MIEDKKEVLLTGAGEAYHIEPLARCIRRANPKIELANEGLCRPVGEDRRVYETKSGQFSRILPPMDVGHNVNQSGIAAGRTRKTLQKDRGVLCRCAKYLISEARSTRSAWRARRFFQSHIGSTAVVNLQSLFLKRGFYWLLGDPTLPFVVSPWGSDVLRNADPFMLGMQRRLLDHCRFITFTTPEFKDVVLAKFGRHLEPKMRQTYFNPGVEELWKSPAAEGAEADGPRDGGKLRLCVGHNGVRENNHLALLMSLAGLAERIKQSLRIEIPMTYGATPEYIQEVEKAAEATGIESRVHTTFWTDEELRAFRWSVDIFVFAPLSDAFSASVTQALAVGSTVILGDWLPNRLRRHGGYWFHEVAHCHEVGHRVKEILENWRTEREKSGRNRDLARAEFAEEAIGRGWIQVYNEALSSR